MSASAILLSAVGVAVGGAAEELVLRIPRGYEQTMWHRIVARNATRATTLTEIWIRVHTTEYCVRGAAQGVAGGTVHVDTRITVPDDAQIVAKFTTTTAGDVLGLWAFGHEWEPGQFM